MYCEIQVHGSGQLLPLLLKNVIQRIGNNISSTLIQKSSINKQQGRIGTNNGFGAKQNVASLGLVASGFAEVANILYMDVNQTTHECENE